MFHLLPVGSAVGETCDRLGTSDGVVLHLKVPITIRGCEACGVKILFSSVCHANKTKACFCLRSLHHRDLVIHGESTQHDYMVAFLGKIGYINPFQSLPTFTAKFEIGFSFEHLTQ